MTNPHLDRNNSLSTGLSQEDRTIIFSLKRRISELEEQLLTESQTTAEKAEARKNLRNAGRTIPKVVSLFDSVESLVRENDRRVELDLENGSETEDSDTSDHTVEQQYLYRGYQILAKYVQPVRNELMVYQGNAYKNVLMLLRAGADGARADDSKSIREAVAKWLNADMTASNTTVLLDPDSRANRGFAHEVCGRYLCPIEYDWDQQVVREFIRSGHASYLVTGHSYPLFLYNKFRVNPARFDEGLFKNTLLVKTWKHIFTSPTSANQYDGGSDDNHSDDSSTASRKKKKKRTRCTRRHVALLIGLTQVNGRSIAYAAVQLRHALSNASYWDMVNGNFNYAILYQHIVEYFESPPGINSQVEVRALLDWWNGRVFKDIIEPGSHEMTNTCSVAMMRVQQLAREGPNPLAQWEEDLEYE